MQHLIGLALMVDKEVTVTKKPILKAKLRILYQKKTVSCWNY